MTDHTSEPIEPSEPGQPRCRACGARLTAGAPWCSLCFTPVTEDEPQPQPAPDDDTQAGAPGPGLEPLAGPVPTEPQDEPTPDDVAQDETHDETHDETQYAAEDEETHQLADELMARLAAQRPAPSRLAGLAPSSGLARAGVSVVGVVLVTGLAFGLMALLGSFL